MAQYLAWLYGQEIWVVLILILILFGGKKIPELMRGVGKGVGELQKGLDEGRRSVDRAMYEDQRGDAEGAPTPPADAKSRSAKPE